MRFKKRKPFCLVCGRRMAVTLYPDGYHRGGHYFGIMHLPIKGTGKYKRTGTFKIGRSNYDVVKWTGKKANLEYWECNDCFNDSLFKYWLEEKIEKAYGKRCPDYEKGCHLCQVWEFYEDIMKYGRRKTKKR